MKLIVLWSNYFCLMKTACERGGEAMKLVWEFGSGELVSKSAGVQVCDVMCRCVSVRCNVKVCKCAM